MTNNIGVIRKSPRIRRQLPEPLDGGRLAAAREVPQFALGLPVPAGERQRGQQVGAQQGMAEFPIRFVDRRAGSTKISKKRSSSSVRTSVVSSETVSIRRRGGGGGVSS